MVGKSASHFENFQVKREEGVGKGISSVERSACYWKPRKEGSLTPIFLLHRTGRALLNLLPLPILLFVSQLWQKQRILRLLSSILITGILWRNVYKNIVDENSRGFICKCFLIIEASNDNRVVSGR